MTLNFLVGDKELPNILQDQSMLATSMHTALGIKRQLSDNWQIFVLQALILSFVMRKRLKRLMPSPAAVKSNPALHFLGDLLHDPNLFHFNRRSVSVALFWGLLIAFLPIPGQMLVAAGAAFYFRCNLPISCALAWVSNPITTPFLVFMCYTTGRVCLGMEPLMFDFPHEYSWGWAAAELPKYFYPIILPFLLGSVIVGAALGSVAYVCVQILWRWQVMNAWRERKLKRAASL